MSDFAKFQGNADLSALVGPVNDIRNKLLSEGTVAKKAEMMSFALTVQSLAAIAGGNRFQLANVSGGLRFGFNRSVRLLGINAVLAFTGNSAYYTGANLFPVFTYSLFLPFANSSGQRITIPRFVATGAFSSAPVLSTVSQAMITKENPFIDFSGQKVYCDGFTFLTGFVEAASALPAPDPASLPNANQYNLNIQVTVHVDPSDFI